MQGVIQVYVCYVCKRQTQHVHVCKWNEQMKGNIQFIVHDDHITILMSTLLVLTAELWAWYHESILSVIMMILYVHISCRECYDTMYIGFMWCVSYVFFKNGPVVRNMSTICTFAECSARTTILVTWAVALHATWPFTVTLDKLGAGSLRHLTCFPSAFCSHPLSFGGGRIGLDSL
jgi:hypothetical protein